MKFRKKPVVVDAFQWIPSKHGEMRAWLESYGFSSYSIYLGSLRIPTLEGTMNADPNDWIIRGVNGEFYPCKPEIFDKTYEAVAA